MNSNEDPNLKRKIYEDHSREKVKHLHHFVKMNSKDSFSYLLLISGLVLLFFAPFFGELTIGLIIALYFGNDLMNLFRNGNTLIEEEGMVRCIVLVVTAITFLFAAPGIFLGIAFALILKQFFAAHS